jgi:hypothetical protein
LVKSGALVVGQKIEWQLPVRCVEQQVSQQPVGLCRGAAKAVAESRADQPLRCCGENGEVEEHAGRCLCGQR